MYYKVIELPTWDINGWKVAADTKEDALALANKRSDGTTISDVKPSGNTTIILGTSDNYEDVMNFREKLDNLLNK